MEMNLYKLSQTENGGYDTFDSCVVCADNEAAARLITPEYKSTWCGGWCSGPEYVEVELIGKAAAGLLAGVVLASYNAG